MDWTILNWVDWAIISVLSVSTLLSLWRGFAREALSLVGWIAGFVLAALFAESFAEFLIGFIDNDSARYVAAYAMIVVSVLMLSNMVAVIIGQLIRLTGLGVLDRLLGTVFGFARGVIILLVVVFLVREMLPEANQQILVQSQLLPHLDLLMQWAQSMFGSMKINELLAVAKDSPLST